MIPGEIRHEMFYCPGTRLLFFVFLVFTLVGCEAKTRHRVLTSFFDGVPPLEPPKSKEEVTAPEAPPVVVEVEAPRPVVYTHGPYRENKCSACHILAQGNVVDTTSALCFRCHKDDKAAGEWVHAPVAGGDCLTCHDPHQSSLEGLLKNALPALCLDCHDEGDLVSIEPHGLADESACTSCHNPHTSDFPGLLISTTRGEVCFNCHEHSDSIAPDRLTHEPAKVGECFSCHVSHTQGGESHLAKEGKALCDECHAVPDGTTTVVHAPVADGDCLTCHNPHGSTIRANLVAKPPDLCWKCHDEKLMAGEVKHAAAEEGGCPQCHSPHESKEVKLLLEPVPSLCAACHEADSDHVKEMEGDEAVCMECHDPHSSSEVMLLE